MDTFAPDGPMKRPPALTPGELGLCSGRRGVLIVGVQNHFGDGEDGEKANYQEKISDEAPHVEFPLRN